MTLKFFSLVLLVFILYSSSFLASASGPNAEAEYTYVGGTGKGPKNWWKVKPEWKLCGDGKQQSPIDLLDETVQQVPQLGELEKTYKPAPAVLKNKGHTIELEWTGDAGQININGTFYKLARFHWHSPSEHTLSGSKFDLELHVVHKNPEGGIAVIGVWYTIGRPDYLLSKLLDNIQSIDDKDMDLGIVDPSDMELECGPYYRYVGSLTTPPCTEGVVWTILREVRTVSVEQLNALRLAVHTGFQENARPVQKLEGRQVCLYTPHPHNPNNPMENDL